MSKEQQCAARSRAMALVDKGWLQSQVAGAVGVNVRTVRQWVQHRREHGLAALLSDERGRSVGEGRRLTARQEKEVRRLIADQVPEQLKLPFALWTRRAVSELLERRYGISLPVRTMGEYLKRWGFTPQKPLKRAYEQCPRKVKQWLEEEYPRVAARAKAEGAEIYWGDQTGINNQPNVERGYAPRGETPTVRQRSRRFALSVMSAVTNRGSARWMVYRGALNGELLIRFMERLVRQAAGRKVHLILDNLRVHHCAPVKEWPAERQTQIEVRQLPSYSPGLNADKRLNRTLESKLGALLAPKDEATLHPPRRRPAALLPPSAGTDPLILPSGRPALRRMGAFILPDQYLSEIPRTEEHSRRSKREIAIRLNREKFELAEMERAEKDLANPK